MKWCLISIAIAVVISVALTYSYTVKSATAERVESVERALLQREEHAREDEQFNQQSNKEVQVAEKKGSALTERSYKYVYLPSNATDCSCDIDDCWMCLDRAAVRGEDGENCPCGSNGGMSTSNRITKQDVRGLQAVMSGQQDKAQGLPDSTQRAD